jgi:hypothetical protein
MLWWEQLVAGAWSPLTASGSAEVVSTANTLYPGRLHLQLQHFPIYHYMLPIWIYHVRLHPNVLIVLLDLYTDFPQRGCICLFPGWYKD